MPKVSIVILSFNGKELLQHCLKSLENQTYTDYEIVIIDNGSSDGTNDAIEQYMQGSSLADKTAMFRIEVNNGVAGGYSEGLRNAHSEYIALLNNDTEPKPEWLQELVSALDSSSETGICASKMIVYGSDIIDCAGDGMSTLLKGYKRGEGDHISCFNQQEHIFAACAGAAIFRKTMLDETGFFDEDFFLLFEDVDLSFRAQLQGWKVLYVPTAVVEHKVRSSIGSMSDTAIYYAARNAELLRIKNIPLGIFLRNLPSYLAGSIMDFFYIAVKNKKAGLYLKAKLDAVKMFPLMLKKRKSIMKNRKVSDTYIASLMTSIWSTSFFKIKLKKLLHG